jgi:hypothetical protein
LAAAVLPGDAGRCAGGFVDRRVHVSGRRSEEFEPPPASTELGYHACISGCAGGLGDLATRLAATPPKGSSAHPAFRNYAGPQHFCHYRGYDFAWVPGTVLGARIGRSILLFRIELGLTGLPCLLCTTRPLTRQGPILRKLRRLGVLRCIA